MAYTLDEFMKLNKNFTKSYDPVTKMAGVQNVNTGDTISFKSGEGQEYGLDGFENQSHVISDLDKFNTSIGNVPATSTMPETTSLIEEKPYESPYSSQIADTLSSISNRPAFSYDASTDQGLIAAQDNAMSAVSREAARRGMLYSDSNKSQLGKSSMALVPQFQQTAYNQYNQQGTDLYNQLNTLSGLESQNYNIYNNDRNYEQNAQNQTFNQNMATTQADLANQSKEQNTWVNNIGQFSDNYQAEINRINSNVANGDNTEAWKLPYLGSARQNKINQLGLDQQGNPIETVDKNSWLDTIGQFSGNYQAEYNKVANDGDTSNDWQLPYLAAARQDKINQLGLDQNGNPIVVDNTAEIEQATAQAIYDRGVEKWKAGLPLTPEEMTALNVSTPTKPVETTTTGGSGGGGGGTTTVSNDFDRNTASSIISNITSNPNLTNNTSPSGKTSYNKDAINRLLISLAQDPSISDATLDYLASYFGI